MLRITMNKSAAGAKKYYCEAYYEEGLAAQHDYYSEHNEAIGKWGGKAAMMLELTGDIDRCDFAKVCDNINPLTSKTLTPRNDKDRSVGYDFNFNCTKSVSLAYTFSTGQEKKDILEAFQQSVRETMEEVERDMQVRVRAKGRNENRRTENIAYGEFTHFTTRPIDGTTDPNLHSHCFVFNASWDGAEQKWKAGQFRQLKQDAPYYEAVFHAKLADKLKQLGYGILPTATAFEIAGIEKSTLDKFSRRAQEIDAYAQAHHITNDEEKSRIGAKTREAKRSDITPEQQQADWLCRLTEEELHALRHLRHRHNTAAQPAKDAALEALRFSLDHHLERRSVACDKEILATAIKAATGKATVTQVMDAYRRDTNILSAEDKLRTFITTKEALQEEKLLIANCIATRNIFRPILAGYKPENPLLNDQQKEAVRHALSSTDGITIITGKAGTGKTTLMKEVKHGILQTGKQIFSFAPSSEASRGVQRSEGFDNADTVARLLIDKTLHPELKHQVIWVDEAGMLSNRDMNKIIAIARAQSARIILSGDTRQHQSVERGDALRIIQQETGIKPVTVSKIQRQKQAEYREAVQYLSNGQTEKGFKKLDRLGTIHEMADSRERVQAIADDYFQSAFAGSAPKEVLVIAPTHAEGELVTGQIRQTLKEHQRIGQEEREFVTLRNRQLTEAEKRHAENYRQGDVLVFHQHSKGIKAGTKLEVAGTDETRLFASGKEGQPFSIPFTEAKKFSVFEPKPITLTEGDKIRITANGKTDDGKSLFNGSTFRVEGFDKAGNIRLSNGSAITPEFGHFNYGYVSTSHGSQGKTADKVIISQSSATFRASSMEQFYVSVSRGRQAVSIYTDDKEHLKQAVSQSAERLSATELVAKRREQEVARNASHAKWREKTQDTHDYLNTKTRNDGLPAAARTE